LNEPAGITGCAPANRPPLAVGGVEKAVRISGSDAACCFSRAIFRSACALRAGFAGAALATAVG
jgi:hypothetical protein